MGGRVARPVPSLPFPSRPLGRTQLCRPDRCSAASYVYGFFCSRIRINNSFVDADAAAAWFFECMWNGCERQTERKMQRKEFDSIRFSSIRFDEQMSGADEQMGKVQTLEDPLNCLPAVDWSGWCWLLTDEQSTQWQADCNVLYCSVALSSILYSTVQYCPFVRVRGATQMSSPTNESHLRYTCDLSILNRTEPHRTASHHSNNRLGPSTAHCRSIHTRSIYRTV